MKSNFLGALLLAFLSLPTHGQPTGSQAIEALHITSDKACTTIDVQFSLPMIYLGHLPRSHGNKVHIQLKPVPLEGIEQDYWIEKKSIIIPHQKVQRLSAAEYESEDQHSTYLIMHFLYNLDFTVSQGSDFRHITLLLKEKGTSHCTPRPLDKGDDAS